MNSLAEVLKIFLEKHLIPTVLAIVIAFVAYLISPDNLYFITKLGFWGFLIFAFAVAFLLVQLIIKVAQLSKSNSVKRVHQKYRNELVERDNNAELEQLWSYVDGLSNDDFLLLQNFLESGNKPIKRNANIFYSGDCLLSSNHVHSTIVQEPKEEIEGNRSNSIDSQIPLAIYTGGKKQYILAGPFYRLLKYSKEQHGRISHFR